MSLGLGRRCEEYWPGPALLTTEVQATAHVDAQGNIYCRYDSTATLHATARRQAPGGGSVIYSTYARGWTSRPTTEWKRLPCSVTFVYGLRQAGMNDIAGCRTSTSRRHSLRLPECTEHLRRQQERRLNANFTLGYRHQRPVSEALLSPAREQQQLPCYAATVRYSGAGSDAVSSADDWSTALNQSSTNPGVDIVTARVHVTARDPDAAMPWPTKSNETDVARAVRNAYVVGRWPRRK